MSNPVREYLQSIGSKGGKAGRGKAKARSSELARKAVRERWKKWRAKQKSLKSNAK